MIETTTNALIERLQAYFKGQRELAFAVLVGSQAEGRAHAESDWDIAIQWQGDQTDYAAHLARMEAMRKDIAELVAVPADKVDLIDIASAGLAMRELIANQGLVLTDSEALPWLHFLQRTWRELEDYYWDELYVA